jgi:hypothetical protein
MEEYLARAFAASSGVAKENAGRRDNHGTVGNRWRILVGEETQSESASISTSASA